jgi:hypothetical protein
MPIKKCAAGALIALLLAGSANASLQERERRSLHSPLQARILNVYTDDGRLFIAGQNLPDGEEVQVRLGNQQLQVLWTSRSLVVTRLPELQPDEQAELEIRRGTRRARIRGLGLRWGLWLPSIYR